MSTAFAGIAVIALYFTLLWAAVGLFSMIRRSDRYPRRHLPGRRQPLSPRRRF